MAPPTVPGWPGNDRLPALALATYAAWRAGGADEGYALRAAAGAVLAALGSERSAATLVRFDTPAPWSPEGWAAFVGRLLVG
ncbi:MAG TPA: hypothetical protein VFS43_40725 [Polyangiaceae bacterium]|nr:hypothetical protein [Polyangiaceae bacterium]